MKVASATEVKTRFDAYLKQTKTSPVIITKRGKPVAMLVAVPDEAVSDDIHWSPRLQEILDAARRRIAAGEGLLAVEFWKRLAKERSDAKRTRAPKRKAAAPTT
jgi:antitoxin Phd